jgi:hypothetical protein
MSSNKDVQEMTQYIYRELLRVSSSLDEVKIVSDEAGEDVDIQIAFKLAYSSAYKEFTYNGSGQTTQIDIWEDNSKAVKLFTKTFVYSGSDLSSVTLVDEVSGKTMLKTFTYSGGQVSAISTVIT